MGCLGARPQLPLEAWKPHETLQTAFEELQQQLINGRLIGSFDYVTGLYTLRGNGGVAQGKDICEALQNLNKNQLKQLEERRRKNANNSQN